MQLNKQLEKATATEKERKRYKRNKQSGMRKHIAGVVRDVAVTVN